MTGKELISRLYNIKNWKCNGDPDMHEAISMAIESLELFGNSEQLPSAQPETIPMDWIQRYADDWEDMSYAYDNPILGMLEDWRREQDE